MFDKLPNYHFSRQKNCEISSTEAQINKFVQRVSSKRKKKERNRVCAAPMSEPAVGQSQLNGPIGDDSYGMTDGIESTNHGESADPEPPHFGIFHDQVQNEVQRLQGGLATVEGAITELAKTFSRHGKIVKTVGERWGTDEALEKEICKLQAQKEGIWGLIEQDRKKHKTEISNLKKEHAAKVSGLQEQADAGEQGKAKYEEMERRLEEQHNEAMQNMDAELKQKKTQLENENAEKILNLEREKSELEDAKAKLEQELGQRTKELDQEKETRTTMQDKLRKDVRELQNELSEIKAKYQVDKRPLEFYSDRYQGLIDSVDRIATSYFKTLPDKAINDPAGTSTRLVRKASVFDKIPIANSDCSEALRLAIVKHLIFTVICSSLWQPFFSKSLWKNKRDGSTLKEIYSRLAASGEDVQQNWKISTLKMLDQFDDGVDVEEQVDDLIARNLIAWLQPLLDEGRVDRLKEDLKVVFVGAIELGKIAERDQSPVCINIIPSMSDRDGWKEYLSEEYEASDASDVSATSLTMDPAREPLFVNPKIFRWAAREEATTPMATTSATATAAAAATTTATASSSKVEVIQPGYALFSDTGIFQDGASEWQRIWSAGREVARSINGRGRRQSMSVSMTSSGVVLKSPTQRWPLEGPRDFD